MSGASRSAPADVPILDRGKRGEAHKLHSGQPAIPRKRLDTIPLGIAHRINRALRFVALSVPDTGLGRFAFISCLHPPR